MEYQGISSLTDYLLVSQDVPLVEHYARGEVDHRDYQRVTDVGGSPVIPSLSITLALSDIYD